jgi:hypothetical protein
MPVRRRLLTAVSLGTLLVLGTACGEGSTAAGHQGPGPGGPPTTLVAAADTSPATPGTEAAAPDPETPSTPTSSTAATLPPAYPAQSPPSSLYPLPNLAGG